MAQNTNTSLSLANLIDILNKAQSIDRRYGVYDTEADALTAMAQYGLDGRLVAVYTDKANGVCKLYKYNEVHHRLDSVGGAESDDTKLDKIWAEIEEQTETLLTDYVVVNQGNQLYKTTVAKLLANVADTEIFVTVSTLPATGVENKIYLVPSESPEDQNQLEEWIWIEDDWERIGGLSIDLSNYYTKTQINDLLNNKADKTDPRLTNSREWTASTVSQSEAEEGTSTTRRAWTAQRVRQAISGWWDSIGTTFGKGFISLTNATQAREKLALGDSATKDVGQSRDTVMEGDDDRIVDGGVVRESILLTSKDNIDDIITPGHYHIFEGDIPVGFPRDSGGAMKVFLTRENNEVFQIIYGADNTLLTRSLLWGDWTDWNRYAPTHWVNNNFAKLSDIYKENAVLDGDWFLKPNTEDTYNVIAREYIINKVLYTDTITGEVTRAPRHATLRRWDMITVESDHTFLITSGVPALDPTRPIPNKQQAVLTYIFVSAVADAPAEPDFLLLYDENVGEPAESNVTTGAPSIVDLDSTEAPFQGTTHILFKERVSDTVDEAVVFTFTTLQNLNNYGKLILHMATSKGGAANNHFLIHVKNGNTTIASFSSVAISWSPTGVGNWERGVLDMVEYANLPHDEFDKIIIDASNGPGWDGYIQEYSKLDYIFLTEKDDTTPVNPVVIQKTSDIPINDGATGDSRYAEMKDLAPKLNVKTANFTINPIADNQAIIINKGFTCTLNPNLAFTEGFSIAMKNDSSSSTAIVMQAKAGTTFSVNGAAPMTSGTVSLSEGGTCTIVFSLTDSKFYLDGAFI